MPGLPVCLDASFLLRLLLDGETAARAEALWEDWRRDRRQVAAPTLLYYEVANALWRYAVRGEVSPDDARELLELALRLDIQLFGDAQLHRRALELARGFAFPAAYDAHYLALAERLGAELWTADARLVGAVRDRLPWVRRLAPGEDAPGRP